MIDIEAFSKHVEKLCRQHGIRFEITGHWLAHCHPRVRKIEICPIKSEIDYANALHELGHVVLRHRPEQTRAWKELLAWRWAFVNSAHWTPEMTRHLDGCLKCWGINRDELVYFKSINEALDNLFPWCSLRA